MRPTKKERRTSENYLYKTDQLIVKMKGIIDQTMLHYSNDKPVTPKALIQFLYKIDFITAKTWMIELTESISTKASSWPMNLSILVTIGKFIQLIGGLYNHRI